VGPNGSGKTTFYEQVLFPVTNLSFVNANVIAAER
jgi:predicted ABC-type ATPase